MSHRSSNVSKHRKPSTKLLFLNSRFLNNTQESLHAPFLQFLSHDLKAKIKELASSSFANTFGLTLDFFWVLLWFFFLFCHTLVNTLYEGVLLKFCRFSVTYYTGKRFAAAKKIVLQLNSYLKSKATF